MLSTSSTGTSAIGNQITTLIGGNGGNSGNVTGGRGGAVYGIYIFFKILRSFSLIYVFDIVLHGGATLTAYNNIITNFAGGAGGLNGTGLQNKINAAEYGIFISYQGIRSNTYLLFSSFFFFFPSLPIRFFVFFWFFAFVIHLIRSHFSWQPAEQHYLDQLPSRGK